MLYLDDPGWRVSHVTWRSGGGTVPETGFASCVRPLDRSTRPLLLVSPIAVFSCCGFGVCLVPGHIRSLQTVFPFFLFFSPFFPLIFGAFYISLIVGSYCGQGVLVGSWWAHLHVRELDPSELGAGSRFPVPESDYLHYSSSCVHPSHHHMLPPPRI